MKAALLNAYGDVDQFEIADIPAPKPGPGEILLEIEASAINPFDLILRQGYMAQYIPLPLPAVLGTDAAGVIVELGADVAGFSIGDRVAADFAHNGRGAHAEYGVVAASSVAKLPGELSFEEGAALVKAGLMGRQAVEALGVKAGDRVLVSGALGSVGRAAVQYLLRIDAVPVGGVRASRLGEARDLAGDAIDITVPPGSADFDFAVSAAGPVAGNLIASVRDGGTIASIVPVPESANVDGRVTILELYHRTDAAMIDDVLAAAAHGDLVVPIAQTLTLADIAAAHRAVDAGASGKIVLKH